MNTLTGTFACLRLAARRNRTFWLCWIVGLAVLVPMTAAKYDTIIAPGTDPRATIEPLRTNPAMLALLGPAYDLYTKGGFVFWRVGGFCSMLAGMMGGLGVIRATRAEEETGRLEVLRCGGVGRHAPLAAGLLLGALGSLALALVAAALAVAAGLPVIGSLATGLAVGTQGLVFTGLGAVVAQVFASARTARQWSVGELWGGMFVARMIVDGASGQVPGWVRWAIPLEWGMLIRPFSNERWWVALVPLAMVGCSVAVAFRLESVRDHGAGLVTPKPGRAHAAAWLSGPFTLAWRLQRGTLIGWTLGIALSALGCGSIVAQLNKALAGNPQLGEMLQKMGGSTDVFVAFHLAMLSILATVCGLFGATVLNRLHSEETRGLTEPMLATATSRTRYALSHLWLALAVPSVAFVLVGALLPVAQAQRNDDWTLVATYARAALALLPGLWLVMGLAMALVGGAPRLTGLVWAVLGWTLFATWFSVLIDMPAWMTRLHPWGHLAHVPRDPMNWTAWILETLLALGLLALGLDGYRRRAIPQ